MGLLWEWKEESGNAPKLLAWQQGEWGAMYRVREPQWGFVSCFSEAKPKKSSLDFLQLFLLPSPLQPHSS